MHDDAVFVRGVGRWHMSPDSRLQAEFAYADGEQDTDDQEMEILEWGVRYDMILAGLPLIGDTQMFLGYRGVHADNGQPAGDTGDFTEHTIMVGTSHSFGGSTIKEVERYGAGLDLPDFVRWGIVRQKSWISRSEFREQNSKRRRVPRRLFCMSVPQCTRQSGAQSASAPLLSSNHRAYMHVRPDNNNTTARQPGC